MNIIYGISWNDSKGNLVSMFMALLLALSLASAPLKALTEEMTNTVSVIVMEEPGSGDQAEQTVTDLGGTVERRLDTIHAFVARVPEGVIYMLQSHPAVRSVTPNRKIQLFGETFEPTKDPGSLWNTNNVIKTQDYWRNGFIGKGVDIAMIDSGVSPVVGLDQPAKLVNGADLSFESQAPNLRYLDSFGHGTHLAGIMAGRDNASDQPGARPESMFIGVAPGARVVSVKVANAHGATDVSQVLAGINWVIEHRYDNGMNIRVLNLSFGTDGTQPYTLDPLTYAAEVAWHKGIVVVVSVGNSQFGSSKLNNPAYDPYVIAVGANDTKGTYDVADDTIPDWSARGDGTRNPDLVAPGKSIVSLRVPGSYIDQTFGSTGYVNERFFRGSGTSQSAAVVSGAAALVIQQRPTITPDQVKALLTSTASRLPVADSVAQGAGMLNLRAARTAPTPSVVQSYPVATGTGTIEGSRGSVHVIDPANGVELRGEMDIFGATWSGNTWSGNTWSGNTWSGGVWNGNTWSGNTWSGNTWSGNTWSGNTWSGNTWSGNTWSGNTWSGNTWSGGAWGEDYDPKVKAKSEDVIKAMEESEDLQV